MEARPRKLVLYETLGGRCPWQDWFDGLKDRRTQQSVDARLLRLQRGNLGDTIGPGLRISFAQDGDTLVILLCGGSKGSQTRDVERAKAYWRDYRS
jgi:putative component of toxin-antitoxin plasmid stabilization module